MLTGIRVYSADSVWRQILADLNATVVDCPDLTCVNIDELNLVLPVSPIKLKTLLLNALDCDDVIARLLGPDVTLSRLPAQIVVWLDKTGGMSASELKVALGYAPDATTHTVDTAICQLRKKYGHDFIVNENGVYKLGRI